MAKRFIDSDIFDKAWFMALEPEAKAAFFYLLLRCDISGVWSENYPLLSMQVGGKFTRDRLLKLLGDHIEILPGDKVWVVEFCSFQYPDLRPDTASPALKAVLKLLKKRGLFERVCKGYANPFQRVKDKDKDKDKDIHKVKDAPAILEKGEEVTPIGLLKSISGYEAFGMGKARAEADGLDVRTESITWACWIISKGKDREMQPHQLAADFNKWMNNSRSRGGRKLDEKGAGLLSEAMNILNK